MKKILTLIAFVAISLSSFAQTIWKDTVVYNGFPKDGTIYTLYDTIYNHTADPVTISWWKASESLLPGWTGVGICDFYVGGGSCFPFNDMSTHTFTIDPGDKATIDIQMKAIPTAGDNVSYVTIGTSIGNMTFKFVTWPTATKDFDNNSIVNIYPNPASDYVNIILNDKRITNVNVVNVIGRRIAKFNFEGKNEIRVPLDKVSNGIYLLQFADANGKVLGVRRVTKQ